jgi:hypothetical protein
MSTAVALVDSLLSDPDPHARSVLLDYCEGNGLIAPCEPAVPLWVLSGSWSWSRSRSGSGSRSWSGSRSGS